MADFAAAIYGAVAYVMFLCTFVYAIGFVADAPLPKTIDSASGGPLPVSVAIDVVLLGLFAIQHSVMARPWFKRMWAKIVPPPVERSTYDICASATLLLLFWQWRSIVPPVWRVTETTVALSLQIVSGGGWLLVLLSTFALSHFELFGLKQVYVSLRGSTPSAPEFKTPSVYRIVRHPIYLGFLLAFWATPLMTVGHLIFALGTTGYILIGIQLE